MKNKTQKIKHIVLPALILGVLVSFAGSASAHGMPGAGMGRNFDTANMNEMFTSQANMLGVTTDEVKNAWSQGKDIMTLAKEKGIDEATLRAKMNTVREAEMKAKIQELVTKGIITQDQANKRIETMKTKMTEKATKNINKKQGKRF